MAYQGLIVSNTKVQVFENNQEIKLEGAEVASVKDESDFQSKIAAKAGRALSQPILYHKDPDGNLVVQIGALDEWVLYDSEYLLAKARNKKEGK